jgi:large subunit ribosomal protein L6
MKVVIDGDTLTIVRPSDNKEHRSLHGLTRTLVNNMVIGVTDGFTKALEINGVGYRAAMQGKVLNLTLGYSHPVNFEAEAGITIEVPQPNQILVKGADKERVGAVAAKIRSFRAPEPYKGKGIKYVDEYIRRKEGKTGAKKK